MIIGYNLDMANLPASTAESTEVTAYERFQDAIVDQIAVGRRPDEIARLTYPHDHRKRRSLRRRLWYMVQHDEHLAHKIALRARAELLLGLVQSSARLARSGRPDAIKLLFEASGFHNPRIQHDHSGEINIKLSMPRPERPAIEGTAEEVVD